MQYSQLSLSTLCVCVCVCVCVQIAPLKVRREWYKLDKEYIDKIAHELGKQLGDSERLRIVSGE